MVPAEITKSSIDEPDFADLRISWFLLIDGVGKLELTFSRIQSITFSMTSGKLESGMAKTSLRITLFFPMHLLPYLLNPFWQVRQVKALPLQVLHS